MPWTKDNVPSAAKNLSESQREKFVAIANNVLRDCIKNGGKNCEGKAIRIALSKVKS